MLTTVALLLAASSPGGLIAPWSVNSYNTLIWDGKPYMPIGVRVEGDPGKIAAALDAGVQDLIVELPVNGVGWDEALEVLNLRGARWFLAVSSAAPAALGTAVEPQGYRIDIEGKLDVEVELKGAEQVFTLIADKRSSQVKYYGTHDTPDGLLKESFDSRSLVPSVLLLYPVVRDLTIPDFWEGFDAHRDALLTTLRDKELGEGFRGIIDPMGAVAKFPTPDIQFVPRSPIFALEMEAYLRDKYGAVSTCLKSWSVSVNNIHDFETLARLVPLWSEYKGVSNLWDPVQDKIFVCDRSRSMIWTDIRTVVRSTAVRRYSRLVSSIETVANVPVIQTWGGWTGPYDGPRTGLAGVGFQLTASSISDVIEGVSRPASTVLQNGFGQVLMATDFKLEKDSLIDLPSALLELRGLGARGMFLRTDDKAQLEAVAALARRQSGDDGDSQWKPNVLFYPEGARDPASPMRLYGGTWMLPSPAAGNRLDLGSTLKGYYYSGYPSAYTVIWAVGEPIKTKLFMGDPNSVQVRALDGSEVRIRIKKEYIELEITEVPLVFSGINDIPVPEISFQETGLMLAALFSNFGNVVDPGGEQQFLFAQNADSFKRNPIGGFSALTRQFNILVPRAAPYLWIEAERSPDASFSEPGLVPGSSAGECLSMSTKLAVPGKSYYARYPLKLRKEGQHEVWIAADIPEIVRDDVRIRVGDQVLKIESQPISYYGLNLAWYRFGTAELKKDAEVVIEVVSDLGVTINIDVLVLSPVPFHPTGGRPPIDFIRPPDFATKN